MESAMSHYFAPMWVWWLFLVWFFLFVFGFWRVWVFFFKGLNRFPEAACMYWGIQYGVEMEHRSDTGLMSIFTYASSSGSLLVLSTVTSS